MWGCPNDSTGLNPRDIVSVDKIVDLTSAG